MAGGVRRRRTRGPGAQLLRAQEDRRRRHHRARQQVRSCDVHHRACFGMSRPSSARRPQLGHPKPAKRLSHMPRAAHSSQARPLPPRQLCPYRGRPSRHPTRPLTRLTCSRRSADLGVNQFVLVSSLGTGKLGWPAGVLNLFGGVLIWKREAEKVLETSGMSYTIVRPGTNRAGVRTYGWCTDVACAGVGAVWLGSAAARMGLRPRCRCERRVLVGARIPMGPRACGLPQG
jgi:hypothetical protein